MDQPHFEGVMIFKKWNLKLFGTYNMGVMSKINSKYDTSYMKSMFYATM